MTLHLAIEEVLSAIGRPLTSREIADEVNRRRLYRRGDGTPLPPSQVSARVKNYPALFTTTSNRIWLTDRALPCGDEPSEASCPAEEAPRQRPELPAESEMPMDAEAALLGSTNFRSADDIDAEVPDEFGLYAIRVRDVTTLPEPYRGVATARGASLIYIGEATGQTLAKRFLGNELRGRGHGTFFRSIGAVLGYRPPVGSLIGKGNQRNYRFSAEDTLAIVRWINVNLEVAWVAFEEGVHAAEVALIRTHTPLLNLRDNPAAMLELSRLRAVCVQIATTPANL